jgi:hypothetical protein
VKDFMEPKMEFTDRESYLIHFYRDPRLCSPSRQVLSALYYIIPSIVFMAVSILQESAVWSFIGYGLLLVYLVTRLSAAAQWAAVVPSILAKYEARIRVLEAKLLESEKKP